MSSSFEYIFPAIKGIQARREYFVSMCPLRLIPKIFIFDEEELPADVRAQRTLNKNRLPEIVNYLIKNPGDYTFSALTASIDGEVTFESYDEGLGDRQLGRLRVPMTARFIINDGQHRRAAIELAMREKPELADESIAVVFFVDRGLERCQQMFADLNRYAIRPSKSIGVLYDHRDQMAKLAKLIVLRIPLYHDLVDMEKSTLALRSRKLFTLSAIYTATNALFASYKDDSIAERARLGEFYWNEIAKQFPDWKLVRDGRIPSSQIRTNYIHSHGITLQAMGKLGSQLLTYEQDEIRSKLMLLKQIDWSRANTKLWEGRAMIGGRISKSESNVILTTNVLKRQLGLGLTPEEQAFENAFLSGENKK
ncbi:MAG: DNA sulfur modification protein DndB [Acidobacteria bacterium]|nr:DNA sulfur modification protein DndB [Acidobacteriota bacterium]